MHQDDTLDFSINKRLLRRFLVVMVTLAVAVPTAAWAGHQFNDVPSSNTFHADIDWMRDKGVTKGCNPPENTEYCPKQTVTREQMAAFMHRLETEGVFLPAGAKATDADKLDGLDSTDFLPPFAKIRLSGTTLSVLAERGLTSAVRDNTGDYTLTFDESVAGCAYSLSYGAYNGATQVGERNVSVNTDSTPGSVLRVHAETGSGSDVDVSFSVVVHC